MMRYAIYYAPDKDDPLWAVASRWLGRDALSGAAPAQPTIPGVPAAEIAEMTAPPRRYGFHATLKPPFRLADDTTETDLVAELAAFAASTSIDLPIAFRVAELDGFLALRPTAGEESLGAFADSIVDRFDRFRAPAGKDELARRIKPGMTAGQVENLKRWGYPHVFKDFRFHLTLTGRLEPDRRQKLQPLLEDYFAGVISTPRRLDALALFAEAAPGADFRLLKSFPLAVAAASQTAREIVS